MDQFVTKTSTFSTLKMDSNRLNQYLLLTFIVILISGVNCDIRCHCNQPACVRTGYMCKSTGPQAACFVEHSGFVNVDRSSDISRHGCIEMLPIEERTPCLEQALANFASQQNGGNTRSTVHHRHYSHGGHHHRTRNPSTHHNLRQNNKSIMCCLDDMCNYVKAIVEDANNPAEETQSGQGRVPSRPNTNRVNNNEDIDSLGKHLQESYGANGSFSQNGSLWFELLTFGVIIFLLAVLALLILFGIRFIRQDDLIHKKHLTQLPNRSFDQNNGSTPKRSILDWKCFMSTKSANPHSIDANNRQFNNSKLYEKAKHPGLYHQKQAQTKHSLLLSVKVDVDSGDNTLEHMTKLEDDLNCSMETNTNMVSNLPNIISAHMQHSVPQSEMTVRDGLNDDTDLDNRAPMNCTSNKFTRERQNSIYLSLLPQSGTQSHSVGQQNPNFDLISNSS